MHDYLKLRDCYITYYYAGHSFVGSLVCLIVYKNVFARSDGPRTKCLRNTARLENIHSSIVAIIHDHLLELIQRDRLVA